MNKKRRCENMNKLQWKRVYETPENNDGYRILVDRLWPRGLKKENAKIDYWAKSITPSAELRQGYHKEEINYDTFAEKYGKELGKNPDFNDFMVLIKKYLKNGNVTLVYANKIPELSHIPTLKDFINLNL